MFRLYHAPVPSLKFFRAVVAEEILQCDIRDLIFTCSVAEFFLMLRPPESEFRFHPSAITKWRPFALVAVGVFAAIWTAHAAENPAVQVKVSFADKLGPLEIDRLALGQGGLSEEPMWDNRIAEIRALGPRLIRLFVQEYFDLLPEHGRYHFEALDRSVDTILK